MTPFLTFFRKRADRQIDQHATPTNKAGKHEKITAGGQMSAPNSTIIVTQPQRFNIDLQSFKTAISSAENVDYTMRTRLYDIYTEALLDPHLFAVIEKRKSSVLGSPIEFRRDGIPDETINENIESPWFYDFLGDILDAKLWGFTLCQFNTGKDGYVDYFCVPRKNVDPQLRLIKRRQTDLTGISFEEYSNLLMINGKDPLGILARCAPYTIYKRGTFGDWAQYSELFGMPIRDYAYDAADEDARERTIADAVSQGAAAVYIHPDGTKLNFIEAKSGAGSAEIYDRFIDTCNAELSKAILGNTLTTEASSTGTQALGTVHQIVEKRLEKDDKRFILNVLNYHMTDIFAKMGINTSGGKFSFIEPETIGVKDKADLFAKAQSMGLPLEDDYIYEQLGIEKPSNYSSLKSKIEEERKERRQAAMEESASPSNRGGRFFGEAPDKGALKW